MGAGRKSNDDPGEPERFHNPFASLGTLHDQLPAGTTPPPKKTPVQRVPARAVVRLERKGRGGKEVTIVSHLELKPRELEIWLKALKTALGCGGSLEEDLIVIQGDQRERVKQVLTDRGIARVTVAN